MYRCGAPGHTKQSVQLKRSLWIIDSPGVIFEDDDSIQGQKSSVLLRNVPKPEDVDDPVSVGVPPPISSQDTALLRAVRAARWAYTLDNPL
jgi:hypothetical protein